MMIEFFGLPGSGKSFFLRKFFKNTKFKKKRLINYSQFFFENYFIIKQKSFNDQIQSKLYYQYFRYNSLKSNILFKKQYFKLLKNLKYYNFKKYKKLINLYKKLVNRTTYNKNRKKRLINHFLIDLISYDQKKNVINDESLIISDEGFYQKCFMNYNNFGKVVKNRIIDNYIQKIPPIDIAVFINERDQICFDRVRNRKYGFNYHSDSIDIIKDYRIINLKILSNLKKKRINTLKINSNKFFKKSVIKLDNVILKK